MPNGAILLLIHESDIKNIQTHRNTDYYRIKTQVVRTLSVKENDYKSLIAAFFILLILLSLVQTFTTKNKMLKNSSLREACWREVQRCYCGRVLNTHISEKGSFYLQLQHPPNAYWRHIVVVAGPNINIIRKGDSISKEANDSFIKVFKSCAPDSLVIIEFDCSSYQR